MLHLIPAPLHRQLLRIAHRVRKRWWRLRKPVLQGVSMIALDEAGRVLLARQSYGTDKWVLPGGALDRGETPLEGALRELREETGCGARDAVFVGVSEEGLHGSRNRVHVCMGRATGTPRPDNREIVELRFFPPGALPGDTGSRVVRRLALARLYSKDS